MYEADVRNLCGKLSTCQYIYVCIVWYYSGIDGTSTQQMYIVHHTSWQMWIQHEYWFLMYIHAEPGHKVISLSCSSGSINFWCPIEFFLWAENHFQVKYRNISVCSLEFTLLNSFVSRKEKYKNSNTFGKKKNEKVTGKSSPTSIYFTRCHQRQNSHRVIILSAQNSFISTDYVCLCITRDCRIAVKFLITRNRHFCGYLQLQMKMETVNIN